MDRDCIIGHGATQPLLERLLLTVHPFLFPSIAARSPFFDLSRGWDETIHNPRVLVGSSVAIAFSIGFFNFFGLSVIKHVSATARSITDTSHMQDYDDLDYQSWTRLGGPRLAIFHLAGR